MLIEDQHTNIDRQIDLVSMNNGRCNIHVNYFFKKYKTFTHIHYSRDLIPLSKSIFDFYSHAFCNHRGIPLRSIYNGVNKKHNI